MKKLLLAMSALAALSLLAPASGVAQPYYNQIGIYTTEDADPASAAYTGAPGSITAYVVIQNPRNYNFGAPGSGVEQDISVIGGFEFRLSVPANVFLLGAVLPPSTTNFATSPEFLCGTNLPVTNGLATCLTLSLGAFEEIPSDIFLVPLVDAPQSVSGELAITDYNDDFRLNPAYPASGSYEARVFALWPTSPVVPTEDTAWGDVKSLYR